MDEIEIANFYAALASPFVSSDVFIRSFFSYFYSSFLIFFFFLFFNSYGKMRSERERGRASSRIAMKIVLFFFFFFKREELIILKGRREEERGKFQRYPTAGN